MNDELSPTIELDVCEEQTSGPSYAHTTARARDWNRIPSEDDSINEQLSVDGNTKIVKPRVQNFQHGVDEEVSLLEKFEGFVSQISEGEFRARFRQHEGDHPVLEAEFFNDELSEADRGILDVGMPLVWSIVRERRNGGIRRSSILYVRRIPGPDKDCIEKAGRELGDWLNGSAE